MRVRGGSLSSDLQHSKPVRSLDSGFVFKVKVKQQSKVFTKTQHCLDPSWIFGLSFSGV